MQILLIGIIVIIVALWAAGLMLHLAGGIIKALFGVTGVLILVVLFLVRSMNSGNKV